MDVENLDKGVLCMPRPRTKRSPGAQSKADAELGARLKVLRKERGLSQAELAEQIGVDQRTVSFYEIGYIRIPARELIKMAGILRASLKEFTGANGSNGNGSKSRKVLKVAEKIEHLPPKKQRQVVEYIELLSRATAAA